VRIENLKKNIDTVVRPKPGPLRTAILANTRKGKLSKDHTRNTMPKGSKRIPYLIPQHIPS